MNEALLRAIVTIVSGAVAGGLTNTLAIWMLFHPHRPPSIGRRRLRWLQGVIPKNQKRLAKSVGRTVGERLLTREDLMRTLGDPEFRDAFDQGLGRFLHEVIEVERPSVAEMLGPELTARARVVLEDVAEHAVTRVENHVRSDAFAEAVEARAASLIGFLAEQPVSDVLTPPREAQVADGAGEWVARSVAGDRFRETVSNYVRGVGERLLVPDLTLRKMVPSGAIGAMEQAIADFMPLAVTRLASALEDRGVRASVERAVHEVLDRFVSDLQFHQRLMARVVLSPRIVGRVVATIRDAGAERITELFRERAEEKAMATGVRRAIDDMLDRPVTEVLGSPSDPAVVEAMDAMTDWLVALARDPAAHEFLVEQVQAALERASKRTWGELLEGVPPERVSEWVVAGARSDMAVEACRKASRQAAATLLARPVGRPGRWLPEGGAVTIRDSVSEPLWQWLQGQVPSVVERMDVGRRVEEKLREFPTPKMEEIVRRVTDRELRMIVYLGYGLGAIVGSVLVVVNRFLP